MKSCRSKPIRYVGGILALVAIIHPLGLAVVNPHDLVVLQDEKRNAATAARQQADDLVKQGTPEALREAVVKFELAAKLFEELNDARSAAIPVLQASRVYLFLEEPRKALVSAEKGLALLGPDRNGSTTAF